LSGRDKCIDDLEAKLQQKFLKYCDPLVPLHNLTAIAARAAVAGMRLRAHHPRQYPDNGASLPQSEKDMLFSLSLKIMQYDALVHANKSLQRYLWHVRVYFQWHAFIYLLSEMRYRTVGDDGDRAWEQVEEVFKYHPEMVNDNDYALYVAIRSLTLRAWEARKVELKRLNLPVEPPEIILKLRAKAIGNRNGPLQSDQNAVSESMLIEKETTANKQTALPYSSTWPQSESNQMESTPAVGDPVPFEEPSPMDWEQWDNLLRSMDIPDLDTSLDTFFK